MFSEASVCSRGGEGVYSRPPLSGDADPSLSRSPSRQTNAYVYQNDLVTMLATHRSAGVALEMDLKNPLHVGDEAFKQGNAPWL